MFNNFLEGKMKDRGWEDKDAAKALDVDVSTIGRWLKGITLPERKQLARVAKVFHTSPKSLLRLTDPDELDDSVKEEERRDSTAIILSLLPDVQGAMGALQRMSPERRAAMLMLLRESEPEG